MRTALTQPATALTRQSHDRPHTRVLPHQPVIQVVHGRLSRCAVRRAGMSKVEWLEEAVHGRRRNLDDRDDLRFGVHDEMLYARNREPVAGAQWTGIVTRVAVEMLQSGAVDAVVCVQSADDDRCAPARRLPKAALLRQREHPCS
jgi:coenzyme F420-reducing hydrogenase beta subunit